MFYESNNHSVFLLEYVLILPLNKENSLSEAINQRLREIFMNIAKDYNISIKEWNREKRNIEISFHAHPNTELSKFINAYKAASSRAIRKEFCIENAFWKKTFLLFTEGTKNDNEIETYVNKQFIRKRII